MISTLAHAADRFNALFDLFVGNVRDFAQRARR